MTSHTAFRSSGVLVGTTTLVWLILRRDRLRLAAFVLLPGLLAAGVAAGTRSAYPTPVSREEVVAAAAGNPALLFLRGPVAAPTPGALTAQAIGSGGLLVLGIVAAVLVVRHTRLDEQTGRRELLAAAGLGRQAPLTAALLVVMAAALAMGAIITAALGFTGLDWSGALTFGLVLAGACCCFAAVGGLAAQLAQGPGTARLIGVLAVLGSHVVAGIGDLTHRGVALLSPAGWVRHSGAFTDGLGPAVVVWPAPTLGLVLLAAAISAHRDLAAGVIPPRPGAVHAGIWLRGPLGLAWRVHRPAVVVGAVVLALLGAALAGVLRSESALVDSPAFAVVSDGRDPATAFFAFVVYALAQLTTFVGIAAVLRIRADEADGLADVVLSSPTGRLRWAGSHLLLAAVGTAVALTALGTGAALISGDVTVIGLGLAYWPATAVFLGLTLALIGWLPRASAAVIWSLTGVVVLIDILGELGVVSTAALARGSPFVAVSAAADGVGVVLTGSVLLAVAVGLGALGLAGLRRRDIG